MVVVSWAWAGPHRAYSTQLSGRAVFVCLDCKRRFVDEALMSGEASCDAGDVALTPR